MITLILALLAAAAFVLLGIFIAANNPELAQAFKTKGQILAERLEAEAQALRDKYRNNP